ncbi:hypothetical protein ACTFIU_001602 [Dictyostelium citrinum]
MEKKVIKILEGLSLNDENELKKSVVIFNEICNDQREEDDEYKTNIKRLLPSIMELLKKWNTITDHNIISTALKGLSSIISDDTDGPYFVEIGLVSTILEILDKSTDSLSIYDQLNSSTINFIGDLILYSNYLSQHLVNGGYLTLVSKLLSKSNRPKIIGVCYWSISNIISIDEKFLQKVIDSGIIVKFINQQLESPQNSQNKTNNKIITEMYWCISNSIASANIQQFKFLISEYQLLEFLQSIKKHLNKKIVDSYYDTISQIIEKTLQVCEEEHSLSFYKKFIADSFINSILTENPDNYLNKSKFDAIKDNLTFLNDFIQNFK